MNQSEIEAHVGPRSNSTLVPLKFGLPGISPASPTWKPLWEASCFSCSWRSRRGSSGPQSSSTPTRPPYRFLCAHLRRRPGHSSSCQSLRPFTAAPPDVFTEVHRASIISTAARNQVPAVYWASHFARNGGLLSYGADQIDTYRRGANLCRSHSARREAG